MENQDNNTSVNKSWSYMLVQCNHFVCSACASQYRDQKILCNACVQIKRAQLKKQFKKQQEKVRRNAAAATEKTSSKSSSDGGGFQAAPLNPSQLGVVPNDEGKRASSTQV